MSSNKRSSEYVKANDDRFGLRESSRAHGCASDLYYAALKKLIREVFCCKLV
jgi:hypothetical protein